MSNGTAFPGWYVEFQAAVLRQLPRPGVIDAVTAEGWCKNQAALNMVLVDRLVTPRSEGGETRNLPPAKAFKTFCTIKLGTIITDTGGFRTALKEANCNIGDWANDILGKPAFTVSTKEKELELVVVSVVELGFKDGASRRDIFRRAHELGLDLCPNEVGPRLALQYADQPKGVLVIGMEPITDSDGILKVFSVERYNDGTQWLHSYGCRGDFWAGCIRWVFVRRKSP